MAAPDLADLLTELVAEGAEVVWLAGSLARGDAGPYSDIDLGVLVPEGRQRPRAFRIHRATLASIVWTTADATRSSFRDPAQIGGAIPGWRRAALLHDPQGVGAGLQREAHAWTWDPVAERCDRWVSAQMTQLAEEVHKLLNALAASRETNVAIQRNVLAQRLPLILSVHLRILYDTERFLRELVEHEMGSAWKDAQRGALAIDGQSLVESAEAALELFTLACERTRPATAGDAGAVIDHTLRAIEGFSSKRDLG